MLDIICTRKEKKTRDFLLFDIYKMTKMFEI